MFKDKVALFTVLNSFPEHGWMGQNILLDYGMSTQNLF